VKASSKACADLFPCDDQRPFLNLLSASCCHHGAGDGCVEMGSGDPSLLVGPGFFPSEEVTGNSAQATPLHSRQGLQGWATLLLPRRASAPGLQGAPSWLGSMLGGGRGSSSRREGWLALFQGGLWSRCVIVKAVASVLVPSSGRGQWGHMGSFVRV
jgi:hypothetical protein